MSYVVLARKWRPQQFSDLLGQEHISQTLTNAIQSDRIAHAFLFSGPRGVGKTSAARILAKALCCTAQDRPRPEPCGECPSCLEITEGRSTDVFEIDAASHTGVDHVREIVDNVRYLPSSARFKIYVIDEVHMLSTGAFNALLKTLEEPPEHVKFVLATTDLHKVPVTIRSRCQRYEFRRIPLHKIAERLSFILKEEGIDHEPSALSVVARESEGSMRDAQSLLEQVLAYASGQQLKGALLREALGIVDGALIDQAIDGLLERTPGPLIDLVAAVHQRGLDLRRFCDALIESVRDLLVAKMVANPKSALDRPDDEVKALVERAKKISAVELERLFESLCRVAEDVARAAHPRFALEVGLASLAERPQAIPIDQLVEQLARLESHLLGSAPDTQNRQSRAEPRPSGRGSRPNPRAESSNPRADSARSGGSGGSQPSARGKSAAPQRAPSARSKSGPGWDEPPPPDEPPPGFQEPRGKASRPQKTERKAPPRPAKSEPEPAKKATPAKPAKPQRDLTPPPQAFQEFVSKLMKKRPPVAATLGLVRPLVFEGGQVEFGCETAFDFAQLEHRETQDLIQAELEAFFGQKTELKVRRMKADDDSTVPATLMEQTERKREARIAHKTEQAKEHPAVKAVASELGGQVSKIRVDDS